MAVKLTASQHAGKSVVLLVVMAMQSSVSKLTCRQVCRFTGRHRDTFFQRNLLRRTLNIKWSDKVSNEELYERTQAKKWSEKVKTRLTA